MVQPMEYIPKPLFDFKKKLESKKYSIQFLPNKLIQESNTDTFIYKGKKIKSAYLIDIVHNLLLKYYFKKDNSFNLSSLVLKEKYGHLYNYYIDYLVEKNVILLKKKHLKGKNARIYSLEERIIKDQITRYKNKDRTLLKKYKNAVASISTESLYKNKILPEIKTKLVQDLFHIEIDYSRSIFFLDSTIQDNDIYNRNKYSVECINDKHIFYHFDNFGRMHTNFTILKSFIRKNCLLINSEETVEIDIKNSQPLFLTKLIQSCGLDKVDLEEFELFKFLTVNGKFYEYFSSNSDIKEKKKIKEITYKVFFGKNFNNKNDNNFRRLFPTIHNFIKWYKKENGGYKVLAYELQNLESEFIFNKVVKEIMIEYPSINLITVHDSIICQKSISNVVSEIFNRNLSNLLIEDFQKTDKFEEINIYSYV